MKKVCFKCNVEKPLTEFYAHKQMKDGHVNKCKECTKNDVAAHRTDNIDKIRAYDRGRGARQAPEYQREYRAKYPKKYKSHRMIGNAVRDGKIKKLHCEVCNEPAHAHHDDYDYPLSVRWLCAAHHHQWHAKHGEALNAI